MIPTEALARCDHGEVENHGRNGLRCAKCGAWARFEQAAEAADREAAGGRMHPEVPSAAVAPLWDVTGIPEPQSAAAATPAERHADIESRLHDGDIIYAEDLRWLLEERNRLLILWAEAAQQERERLTEEAFRLARFEFKSGPIISDVVWLNDILAILAEPSE